MKIPTTKKQAAAQRSHLMETVAPPSGASVSKEFTAYFWFVGWDCLSLGGHICLSAPNIEIHLPFGFVRIGWEEPMPRWRQQITFWPPRD